MDIVSLLLIGIGLSFDSFAVAVSCGLLKQDIRFAQALTLAFVLAASQAVMPVIGWLVGSSFGKYITECDHWVAFGLLALLGGKMIWESFKKEDEDAPKANILAPRTMISMGIATSIDALIVGVSFAMVGMTCQRLMLGVFIIAAVTYFAVMLGVFFGKKTGNKVGKKADIAGGIILIAIGLKILLEHTVFS